MGDIQNIISIDTGQTHTETAINLLAGIDAHFSKIMASGERFVLRLDDGSQIQAHQLASGSISLFGGSAFSYADADGIRHEVFRQVGNGVVLYKTTQDNRERQLRRARLIVMRAHRTSKVLQEVRAP